MRGRGIEIKRERKKEKREREKQVRTLFIKTDLPNVHCQWLLCCSVTTKEVVINCKGTTVCKQVFS